MTTFNFTNVSTSLNKDKLDLAQSIVGASNPKFMKRVLNWDMFHIIEYGYPYLILMLCVILDMPLDFMIFTNLVNYTFILGLLWLK